MKYSDEALYLRKRLLRLHEFNRILYPKLKWKRMENCILEKTTPASVVQFARSVLPHTYTEEAAREAEFTLVEINGAEPYSDEILLRRHVNGTLSRWRVALMMEAIYQSCGGDMVSTREDLLFSSALWAVKE